MGAQYVYIRTGIDHRSNTTRLRLWLGLAKCRYTHEIRNTLAGKPPVAP